MVSVLLGTFFKKHLNKSAILILGLAIILILSSMFCKVFFKLTELVLFVLVEVLLLLLLDDDVVKFAESVTWMLGTTDPLPVVDLTLCLDALGVAVDWPMTGVVVFNWFDLERVRERTCEADGDCVSVCSCNGGGTRVLGEVLLLLGIRWAVRDEVDDGAERGTDYCVSFKFKFNYKNNKKI